MQIKLMMMTAVAAASALAAVKDLNWKEDVYEPLAVKCTTDLAKGLHGRNTIFERIYPTNAVGDETQKAWHDVAWRGERVNAQFVVWSGEEMPQLRCAVTGLEGLQVKTRFVRYVFAAPALNRGEQPSFEARKNEKYIGDCLDDAARVDMPANGFRPVWVTIEVPRDAKSGEYKGELTVTAKGGAQVKFPLSLTVRALTLPEPKDWAFFLDLWQHPWAVARYHHVQPFSAAHFDLLRPLFKMLAGAGQKTITTSITKLPWNHQNFDAYDTMIKHTRHADGTWSHDYSIFDKYVAFAKECGLGPQLHCYTMATWEHVVYWFDDNGDEQHGKLIPGTPEHEAFWGPFLKDFAAHLTAKGWMNGVHIALDERKREEVMATAHIIQKYAPEFKLQMAGNRAPSEFKGIHIDNYSQAMRLDYISPEFKEEVKTRRTKGFVTTTYICCAPAHPNTFTHSELAEQQWLGIYAAANGFDGMLRWAAFNWPRDPFFDSSFGHWSDGDTYLIYPGARASVRWEMLRDSIETFEKIRILRTTGKSSATLEAALSNVDFKQMQEKPLEFYRSNVKQVLTALNAVE